METDFWSLRLRLLYVAKMRVNTLEMPGLDSGSEEVAGANQGLISGALG